MAVGIEIIFLESSWEMDQTEKNVHLSSITDILNSGE